MTEGTNLLDQVAQAICMGEMFRKWPNADHAFIARQSEKHWQEYERDARFVIEVINGLVAAEEMADATANLPKAPDWMVQ